MIDLFSFIWHATYRQTCQLTFFRNESFPTWELTSFIHHSRTMIDNAQQEEREEGEREGEKVRWWSKWLINQSTIALITEEEEQRMFAFKWNYLKTIEMMKRDAFDVRHGWGCKSRKNSRSETLFLTWLLIQWLDILVRFIIKLK